jgi:predicted metal-dependent RNase
MKGEMQKKRFTNASKMLLPKNCRSLFSERKMTIKVTPLGAGQDVGRSCLLVTVGNKNIMFDCGMHMSYNDERRFPDFSFISKTGNFTQMIDAVIISHLYPFNSQIFTKFPSFH